MPQINLIALATPAFLLLVGVEMIAAYMSRREIYEVRDTTTSLLMGVGSTVVGGVVGFTFFALASALAPFRLMQIEWSILAVVLCFLAEDFSYYWYHRAGHEIRWMWVDHVNHHSSQHYNLSTALRQSWNGFLTPAVLFKAPMIIIGFPLEMMAIVHSVLLIYQFAIHTQYVRRLPRWAEFLFNTPSHHRVHHARNPQYLDANYGGILIIWDRMFGTFVRECDDTKIEYGLVENIATFNLLRVSYHAWGSLWADLRSSQSLRSIIGYLFAPPGWRPVGLQHTSKAIRDRWLADRRLQVAPPKPCPTEQQAS